MAVLLIVEDDRQTNEAICEYLRLAGHKLVPAYDGASALQLFDKESFDLVVLDIMLPKVTGIGVLHEIRNSISASAERMMKLDRTANCPVRSGDEIGLLAQNVNDLYSNLLSTIEHLEQEKDRVSEMERAKVDFLRAASHEFKTPITALNAVLENMILGVGKYQNHAAYLPKCKEMVERLSGMIQEILEASRLNIAAEQPTTVGLPELLEKLCKPYQLIAAANNISFSLDLPEQFTVTIPIGPFSKAVSNVLANAVAYTETGKEVSVCADGRNLVIENECIPVPGDEISRLFEPFYRPDFSRSRENGGNGLGLYIVDTLLTSMNISYSFTSVESPPGMCFTIQL